jgi:hypothetical protein
MLFQKKENQKEWSLKGVQAQSALFWLKWYRIFFRLLFVVICLWGGFLWYYSLYYFHWSDAEKQAYIQSQTHQVNFNENGFGMVLRMLDANDKDYEADAPTLRDMFNEEKNDTIQKAL